MGGCEDVWRRVVGERGEGEGEGGECREREGGRV